MYEKNSQVKDYLLAATLALAVGGFPFIAALSPLIEISSTPLAIFVRSLTALFCIIILFSINRDSKTFIWKVIFFTSIVFWLIYLSRVLNDTLFKSEFLLYEPETYWIWSIGGCLIPLFGMLNAHFYKIESERIFKYCFIISVLAALFSLVNLSTTITSDFGDYDGGRAALIALNPISLGHLGVQIALIGIWSIFLKQNKYTVVTKFFIFGAIALGLYICVAANSRGPIVSFLFVIIFAIVTSNYRNKHWLIGVLSITLLIAPQIISFIDRWAGTQTYARIFEQSQIDDVNTQSRLELYYSGWQSFLNEPFFGSGLENHIVGGYPHNLFIESFMAGGLFAGLAMMILVLFTLIAAYQILRYHPDYGWLAMICIQQVVAVQFSGSVAQSTLFWTLIGASAAVLNSSLNKQDVRFIVPNSQT